MLPDRQTVETKSKWTPPPEVRNRAPVADGLTLWNEGSWPVFLGGLDFYGDTTWIQGFQRQHTAPTQCADRATSYPQTFFDLFAARSGAGHMASIGCAPVPASGHLFGRFCGMDPAKSAVGHHPIIRLSGET